MVRSRGAWLVPAIGIAVLAGALAAVTTVVAVAADPQSANASTPTGGAAQGPAPVADSATRQSDDRKAFYAMGVIISRNLEGFQLSPAEFSLVKSGLTDGFNQRAGQVDLAAANAQIQSLQRERFALFAKKQEEAGRAYLNKAAALPGAQKTGSGLVIVPIRAGTGANPRQSDVVKVNYEGKLIDGTVFDSSIKRGQPASLTLSGVIPCWSEALQLMRVGGKSRVICPPNLAYGVRGAPPVIRPQSTLDFDVDLLEISSPQAQAAPAPPPVPEPSHPPATPPATQ